MKKIIFTITISLLAFIATSIFAQSPVEGESYTVQAGDWLSKIAQKYYGDPLAYPVIVDVTNAKAAADNSFATIDNPDVIEIGQKLWIPANPDMSGIKTLTGLTAAAPYTVTQAPCNIPPGGDEIEGKTVIWVRSASRRIMTTL
jgi:LysM repeat protein